MGIDEVFVLTDCGFVFDVEIYQSWLPELPRQL